MNSTELLNEIKNKLELLKHKGYDKNSFKSGYLLGYAKALQLQQTGVMQQRELLFAFEKFKTDHILTSTDEWRYANVDLFLSKQ